jgi:hypothetical protein
MRHRLTNLRTESPAAQSSEWHSQIGLTCFSKFTRQLAGRRLCAPEPLTPDNQLEGAKNGLSG